MKNKNNKILLVSTLVLVLIFTCIPLGKLNQAVNASGQMIVINPGHLDGVDPGAVNGATGIREVDVNNALSIKVVKTLRDAGYNALLSHPIPGNPGLPTLLTTIPNYDIYSTTICKVAGEKGADLLVSIHHNGGAPSTTGYEFYWSSYHPSVDNDGIYQKYGLWPGGVSADLDSTPPEIALKSKNLANLFNHHFQSLDYVSSRNKITERDDAITRKTSMPSVLIEAGFISNNAESLRLADGNNQQKMADKILVSIRECFGDTGKIETTMSATKIEEDAVEGKINVKISGIIAPNGLRTLYVPVWTEKDGQDDLKWYQAKKKNDDLYELTIETKDHDGDEGLYHLHYYGEDKAGVLTFLGAKTIDQRDKMKVGEVLVDSSAGKISVKLNEITAPNGLKTLLVPIWSEKNGQDDLQWYQADKKDDESYELVVETKNHNNDIGDYHIHCYGLDDSNKMIFLSAKMIEVTGDTTVDKVKKSVIANLLGKEISLTIKGVSDNIEAVKVPIWSDYNGQDDIRWYQASRNQDGSYGLTINVDDHNGDDGLYLIHVYTEEVNGSLQFFGNTTIKMPRLIAIAGNSSVNANQLVRYYEASGKVFPQLYKDKGVDLKRFAEIYCEEAKTEGINVEIAFAQMLLETGYLQYGGQVKVGQFNFAGLGAIDGGTGGFDFAKVYGDDALGIRMGIRGHIQHLKCYANSESLKQEKVDPRWSDHLRGKAAYTYWLSIPNNPYKTGWASDPNYGSKLEEKIDAIRK